ncbi:MAG: phosphoglycerate kinase, partial [Candidatus Bathyarchaeia archaeon]
MRKKIISDVSDEDFRGRRVFVRVDFNVPLKNGDVREDFRIRMAIPTIEYLAKRGAKVVVASHLGRPKGNFSQQFSLK